MEEKVLVAAILTRAVIDSTKRLPSHYKDPNYSHKDRRGARQWLGLDLDSPNLVIFEPEDNAFSFLQCCQILDLCPYIVHKAVQTLDNMIEHNPRISGGIYNSVIKRILVEDDSDQCSPIPMFSKW